MKLILFGGIAAIVAGGVYMHGPRGEANVYAMTPEEAYRTLAATKVEPSNRGPFGRLETSVHASGGNKIEFSASGSHASVMCSALITPAEGDKARVDASCGGGGPSSGAAAGLEAGMRRRAFIELLDSTLTGRAYDPKLAQGATAGLWPADVVDHGTFADAASQAISMEAEMRRDIARIEKDSKKDWGAKPGGGGWGASSDSGR